MEGCTGTTTSQLVYTGKREASSFTLGCALSVYGFGALMRTHSTAIPLVFFCSLALRRPHSR